MLSDSIRINGPAGTITTSGEIASEVAIVANTALCSWGGTSCFGGPYVNFCEATVLNACGCVRIGQGVSGGVPLTVTGGISARDGITAGSLSASNTTRGFVSAGRDLADIFATGTGLVDGSGTANYLPVWSDTDTLGNSIACQSSTQLTVAGNISSNGSLSATGA